MDNAELMQRERLVAAFLVLPGQVERLARVLPGLRAVPCQPTDLAEPGDVGGMTEQRTSADIFADPLLQQCVRLREAPLEPIGRAQTRRNRSQHAPVPGGTTQGQALLQYSDGHLQIPLVEERGAEPTVDNDRCEPSAFQRSEAKRLLPVASALSESPEVAQGLRQPRPGCDPQVCIGCARSPVRYLHAPP